ncbi:hypothetical protein CTAYLR_004278 [Chrysophaeum taylorii]|uniref:BZIP domain-containing protein n=1 Tax=Chrysophaeum taylorii TaxID=2483200 RepID=A0AAD7UE48_9STRA|nr:hypothetical protein CTAYLR_004278 [Chrysophaeum taylorii]
MAHDTNALDCLFGPYDFLDTAQPIDGYQSGGSRGRRYSATSYAMTGEQQPAPQQQQQQQQQGFGRRESVNPPTLGGMPPPDNKRARLMPAGDAELQDKADRCRARNREHARQTRRRKKEFVESLQVSVQQLGRENEIMAARLSNLDERAQERERRAASVARILELRVKEEDDPDVAAQWAEVVEPDFELKLPHTPYRSFAAYEATANGRTVSGIPAIVADVKSLRVCLGTLKRRLTSSSSSSSSRRPEENDPQSCSSSDGDVACETECVLERSGLAWSTDGSLMAPWTLRISDAKRQVILQQRGMLRATFRGRSSSSSSSSSRGGGDADDGEAKHQQQERAATLELTFDTVSFWQQLQRGVRPDRVYKPVPNTLDQALQPSDEARVITSASRPFVIEHVNGAWTKLCGYDPDECLGKTLAILQGPETAQETVQKINADASKGHATSALLANYNKEGAKFNNYLRVFPLVDDDGSTKISHMLGVLQNVIG